jgi:hypothetical protein
MAVTKADFSGLKDFAKDFGEKKKKGDPGKVTSGVVKDLEALAKKPKREEEVKLLQHIQSQIKSNSNAYDRKIYERMVGDLDDMIKAARGNDQKELMKDASRFAFSTLGEAGILDNSQSMALSKKFDTAGSKLSNPDLAHDELSKPVLNIFDDLAKEPNYDERHQGLLDLKSKLSSFDNKHTGAIDPGALHDINDAIKDSLAHVEAKNYKSFGKDMKGLVDLLEKEKVIDDKQADATSKKFDDPKLNASDLPPGGLGADAERAPRRTSKRDWGTTVETDDYVMHFNTPKGRKNSLEITDKKSGKDITPEKYRKDAPPGYVVLPNGSAIYVGQGGHDANAWYLADGKAYDFRATKDAKGNKVDATGSLPQWKGDLKEFLKETPPNGNVVGAKGAPKESVDWLKEYDSKTGASEGGSSDRDVRKNPHNSPSDDWGKGEAPNLDHYMVGISQELGHIKDTYGQRGAAKVHMEDLIKAARDGDDIGFKKANANLYKDMSKAKRLADSDGDTRSSSAASNIQSYLSKAQIAFDSDQRLGQNAGKNADKRSKGEDVKAWTDWAGKQDLEKIPSTVKDPTASDEAKQSSESGSGGKEGQPNLITALTLASQKLMNMHSPPKGVGGKMKALVKAAGQDDVNAFHSALGDFKKTLSGATKQGRDGLPQDVQTVNSVLAQLDYAGIDYDKGQRLHKGDKSPDPKSNSKSPDPVKDPGGWTTWANGQKVDPKQDPYKLKTGNAHLEAADPKKDVYKAPGSGDVRLLSYDKDKSKLKEFSNSDAVKDWLKGWSKQKWDGTGMQYNEPVRKEIEKDPLAYMRKNNMQVFSVPGAKSLVLRAPHTEKHPYARAAVFNDGDGYKAQETPSFMDLPSWKNTDPTPGNANGSGTMIFSDGTRMDLKGGGSDEAPGGAVFVSGGQLLAATDEDPLTAETGEGSTAVQAYVGYNSVHTVNLAVQSGDSWIHANGTSEDGTTAWSTKTGRDDGGTGQKENAWLNDPHSKQSPAVTQALYSINKGGSKTFAPNDMRAGWTQDELGKGRDTHATYIKNVLTEVGLDVGLSLLDLIPGAGGALSGLSQGARNLCRFGKGGKGGSKGKGKGSGAGEGGSPVVKDGRLSEDVSKEDVTKATENLELVQKDLKKKQAISEIDHKAVRSSVEKIFGSEVKDGKSLMEAIDDLEPEVKTMTDKVAQANLKAFLDRAKAIDQKTWDELLSDKPIPKGDKDGNETKGSGESGSKFKPDDNPRETEHAKEAAEDVQKAVDQARHKPAGWQPDGTFISKFRENLEEVLNTDINSQKSAEDAVKEAEKSVDAKETKGAEAEAITETAEAVEEAKKAGVLDDLLGKPGAGPRPGELVKDGKIDPKTVKDMDELGTRIDLARDGLAHGDNIVDEVSEINHMVKNVFGEGIKTGADLKKAREALNAQIKDIKNADVADRAEALVTDLKKFDDKAWDSLLKGKAPPPSKKGDVGGPDAGDEMPPDPGETGKSKHGAEGDGGAAAVKNGTVSADKVQSMRKFYTSVEEAGESLEDGLGLAARTRDKLKGLAGDVFGTDIKTGADLHRAADLLEKDLHSITDAAAKAEAQKAIAAARTFNADDWDKIFGKGSLKGVKPRDPVVSEVKAGDELVTDGVVSPDKMHALQDASDIIKVARNEAETKQVISPALRQQLKAHLSSLFGKNIESPAELERAFDDLVTQAKQIKDPADKAAAYSALNDFNQLSSEDWAAFLDPKSIGKNAPISVFEPPSKDMSNIWGNARHIPDYRVVNQGPEGNCWELAGIGAYARARPDMIKRMIKENPDGTVTVSGLHNPETGGFFEPQTFNLAQEATKHGMKLTTKNGDNQSWVVAIDIALDKNLAKAARDGHPVINSDGGPITTTNAGTPVDAMNMFMTGRKTPYTDFEGHDVTQVLNTISDALARRKPVLLSGWWDKGKNSAHAWSAVATRTGPDGQLQIGVANPHNAANIDWYNQRAFKNRFWGYSIGEV